MNFFRRLFKTEEKVLASQRVKIESLDQKGCHEHVRLKVVDFYIQKYGKNGAHDLIKRSNFSVFSFVPGGEHVALFYKEDGRCYNSFVIEDGELVEMGIIDQN